MAQPLRRVVTGHDAQGRSCILFDGPCPNVHVRATEPLVAMTELWSTRETPARNDGHEDAAAGPLSLPPPPRGTVFRIVELPPDRLRNWANLAAIDPAHAKETGHRHPGFHKTRTLDYIIVLQGEVWALMDEGETLLRTGDVLIQRGTHHAWSNRSDSTVLLAGVLIDAEPTT
ncbi:MAG: cupin domain-containing protein [Burkholderiales bacterium]|nr:cupin domain-containing protein [Burkholderiales bacterium]